MACVLTSAFALDCKDTVGGIAKVWIINSSNKGTYTKSASGTITAWSPVANSLFLYELRKETSNFETQEDFDAYMDKYFLSDKALSGLNTQNEKHKEKGNGFSFNPTDGNKKGNAITNPSKNRIDDNYIIHNTMPRSSKTGKGGTGPLSRNDGKTYCLDTGNTNATEIQCVAMRGRNPENPKSRVAGLKTEQQLEARNDGKTNCLTSVQKDNLVIQLNPSKESELLQNLECSNVFTYILNNLNFNKNERNTYKTLSMLFCEIRKKVYEQQKKGVSISFSEKKILRSIMYVKSFQENKKRESKLFGITPKKPTNNRRVEFEEKMRIMWSRTQFGCSPQGRKLEQQYFNQLASFMQVVPYESTSPKEAMHDLWKTKQGTWLLRETLPTIQKIWKPICLQRESIYGSGIPKRLIRRLTPRETGRLQTVPEDILDIMLNCGISDTQLYKMFGNGWTIDVIAYVLSYYKIEKLQPK